MNQTAAALPLEQALNIHHNTPTFSVSQSVAEGAEEVKDISLNDGSFYNQTSQLQYGDRVKISFSVAARYAAHFILIKGLLEFHRAPEYTIAFRKSDATFEVTTAVQHLPRLNKFLAKVAVWLDQELSFKAQLKEVLAFEQEYRAKLAKVYAAQDTFTLFRI
jgi:hypothetical protein